MAEIKLTKRTICAGDVFAALMRNEGWGVTKTADFLNSIPTADVVEVVRCRDCVRRYSENLCPMCFLINGDFYEYTNGNGFCDRGERREPDA